MAEVGPEEEPWADRLVGLSFREWGGASGGSGRGKSGMTSPRATHKLEGGIMRLKIGKQWCSGRGLSEEKLLNVRPVLYQALFCLGF